MLLIALLPIIILVVGLVILRKPSYIVGPITLLITVILALVFFPQTNARLPASIYKGVDTGAKVAFMIWAAFSILEVLSKTNAMESIQMNLTKLSDDKRIHILLIAMGYGAFLEGASGAGAPAAIVAPLLVSMGYNPIVAAAAPLLANNLPVPWGGAGVPTIMGVSGILDYVDPVTVTRSIGRLAAVLALFIPFIMLIGVYGVKSIRRDVLPFIIGSGIVYGASLYFTSNFIGPELVSMPSGLITMGVIALLARTIPHESPAEYSYFHGVSGTGEKIPFLKAISPYLLLIILLPAVRYSVPLKTLSRYGYVVWVAVVIWICGFLGSAILGASRKFISCAAEALKKLLPAAIAICTLSGVAEAMNASGMTRLIAVSLSRMVGNAYMLIVPVIGAFGAFITGTSLGSNLMFNPLHVEAAKTLGLRYLPVVAVQHLSGGIGNMVCIHNIVAVCATVGILGKESDVLKKTFFPFVVALIITIILGVIMYPVL